MDSGHLGLAMSLVTVVSSVRGPQCIPETAPTLPHQPGGSHVTEAMLRTSQSHAREGVVVRETYLYPW